MLQAPLPSPHEASPLALRVIPWWACLAWYSQSRSLRDRKDQLRISEPRQRPADQPHSTLIYSGGTVSSDNMAVCSSVKFPPTIPHRCHQPRRYRNTNIPPILDPNPSRRTSCHLTDKTHLNKADQTFWWYEVGRRTRTLFSAGHETGHPSVPFITDHTRLPMISSSQQKKSIQEPPCTPHKPYALLPLPTEQSAR